MFLKKRSDIIVRCQGNEREIRILLVMTDSERIDFVFKEEIRNKIADISQINIEKMVRKYGEEETVRLMKVIMENNVTMLKLQKKIVELQVVAKEKKRRQEDREQRRREYEERREEEEQRKQKKKEEEEQRKRIDEELRKVEEMRVREERRAEKE